MFLTATSLHLHKCVARFVSDSRVSCENLCLQKELIEQDWDWNIWTASLGYILKLLWFHSYLVISETIGLYIAQHITASLYTWLHTGISAILLLLRRKNIHTRKPITGTKRLPHLGSILQLFNFLIRFVFTSETIVKFLRQFCNQTRANYSEIIGNNATSLQTTSPPGVIK